MTAIMLPLLIGMTGFGVDVSMWVMNKRDLQSAADAAAIAAAWEVANNYDDADLDEIDFEEDIEQEYTNYPEYAAYKEAMKNGFDPSTGNLNIEFVENENGFDQITVTVSQEENLYFSRAVFRGDVYTNAAAATVVIVPTGNYCFLALDPTADGAVTAVGNVDLVAEMCGIAVNSNSDSALDVSGNVDIDIADLHIVGDMDITGSVDLEYDTLETNSSTIPDPYKKLGVPDYAGCDYNNKRVNGNASLSPGVYCGGLNIRGNGTVEMDPGVYIMDCGDFQVSGNGDIIGENVSIILTCADDVNDTGSMDISGNKDITLTAPEAGEDMEGVVIYKDRDSPETPQCNKVVGGSAVILDGAVYVPSDCFRIGGNAGAVSPGSDPCTRLIAKRIELHGNPYIGNECDGSAAKDIGEISIKLVL